VGGGERAPPHQLGRVDDESRTSLLRPLRIWHRRDNDDEGTLAATVHKPASVRPAIRADIPRLSYVIERSVRELQRDDYSEMQIEGALETIFGVDTTLIDDGTYLVVEIESEIVACGGWSKRKTLFGGDRWTQRENAVLDPAVDAAKIRAFFVHPDWARRGLGTLLLESCENAARAAGFCRFEMGATLTGAHLYARRGYKEVDRIEVRLANGQTVPVVRMRKD
jgi:GNAT superfamily N-acetyltransferase